MSSEAALSQEDAIGQFCGVTGADEERAKGLLEACDWNLELAINMHVDTDDGRNNKPSTSSGSRSNIAAGPSTSSGPPIVTIPDSINDEDEEMKTTPTFRKGYTRRSIKPPTSSSAFSDPDNVRPPIPPVRQVLVHNSDGFATDLPQRRYNTRTGGGVSDVYDAFRDFQAEAQWQEMAQEGESSASDSSATNSNKRPTLQDLFRPPLELMFRGSLTSAREVGSQQNKWLLVNIQNGREFACQILNRDVWSHQTVKDIVKEHFIFWQVYHDSFEGARYIQFYKVSSFPHVSIIDPRTGEQMKSWPTSIDHNSFCDSVIEFLAEHPSPDGSSSGANTMKKLRVKEEEAGRTTLYDQSEEAQLEAAIKASLQETENSNSSRAFNDEDSYTDAIESDTDQTQSSIQAHASNSSSSSTFSRINRKKASSNGQSSSSMASGLSTEFCDAVKSLNSAATSTNNKNSEKKQSQVSVKPKDVVEDYKKYLGADTEKFSDLVVRFPDGTRDQFKFPSDSLMKALFLLLTSRGYGMNRYNYVTNFPRRLLHELPSTDTLQDAKLARETIFVERRVSNDEH